MTRLMNHIRNEIARLRYEGLVPRGVLATTAQLQLMAFEAGVTNPKGLTGSRVYGLTCYTDETLGSDPVVLASLSAYASKD